MPTALCRPTPRTPTMAAYGRYKCRLSLNASATDTHIIQCIPRCTYRIQRHVRQRISCISDTASKYSNRVDCHIIQCSVDDTTVSVIVSHASLCGVLNEPTGWLLTHQHANTTSVVVDHADANTITFFIDGLDTLFYEVNAMVSVGYAVYAGFDVGQRKGADVIVEISDVCVHDLFIDRSYTRLCNRFTARQRCRL